MRDNDTCTGKIIAWALSRPVLTKWLAVTAAEGGDELVCTVTELVGPDRDERSLAFLHATGAPLADADALAGVLGDDSWTDDVDWPAVRRAVIAAHLRDCFVLCARPCDMTTD